MRRFDEVDIKHVPRVKDQKSTDLAQIASGYRVSMEKLAKLVEVKEKLTLTNHFSS